MSAETSTWAWEQAELSIGEKLLLIRVADGTSSLGYGVFSLARIARDVGLAERSVRHNLQRLEEKGRLRRFGLFRSDGARTAGIGLLLRSPGAASDEEAQEMIQALAMTTRSLEPWQSTTREVENGSLGPWQSTTPDPSPRARGRDPLPTTTSLPSEDRARTNRTLTFSLEEDPEEEIAEDGQHFLARRTKVDSKVVTAQELRIAVVCMSEFNRQAGAAQSLGPNLTRIVGRIREHPSWDSAKFVRLIQSAFRLRWWEQNGRRRNGKPVTPQVIFGSTQCFENVALDAADEKQGNEESIQKRRGKYDRSVVRD